MKRTPSKVKAIILGAGEGRSLFPLTKDRPKTLLPLGDTTLLQRLIEQFRRLGVAEVLVVAGYKKERVYRALKGFRPQAGMGIRIVENEQYSTTNTLYSLWLALKDCAGSSILVVDGDLICEDDVLAGVLRAKQDTVLAVDSCRVMGEEEIKVRCNASGRVVAIGRDVPEGSAEFLGIAKFPAHVARELCRTAKHILDRGHQAEYYEAAYSQLCHRGRKMYALDVAGKKWMEVDFLTDYEEALRLFGSPRELREFRASRETRRQYLFCPGPVLVSTRVREALLAGEIGHRETEFSELLNRVRMKLGRVYGVTNFHMYSTVVITGSGSAANEAVIGTAGVGKHLLMLSNGEFGERLMDLAEFLGVKHTPLKLRWGTALPLEEVEKRIKHKEIDAVCMVHHETSTGMLNPVDKVGALAKRHRKEFFVDAVSSIGAVPIDVEANDITFCTASANKAIASVPGLSFVCGKKAAFEELKTVKANSMYLDLYKHFVSNERQFQTPNTPAVNLFFALEAALDGILDAGLQQAFAKHRALAAQLRQGLRELGFRFLIAEEHMSPVLTTAELAPGFGADEFHDKLKRLGYITYPGKGVLRDRVFQVANIGELTPGNVKAFLKALAQVIQ
jgi:2-aminoethylphosphonate-pyruvate transaminase